MKNYYQKIIAFLYLLVVVGFSFYTPLYNRHSELEFGSLWSNKLDWFKFGYIFFFINLLFILLFYFFKNKPNPDVNSPIFKRKLKRELKVFAIGIIAFVAFLGFIEVFNLYQENKKEKINEEIYERNLWLSDHISKRPPIKLVDEYGIPIKKRIVPKPSDVLKKSSFTPPSDAVLKKSKIINEELINIVANMVAAGESEENIAIVIKNFDSVEDNTNKLYSTLTSKGYYTKSKEEFLKQLEDPNYLKKIYGVVSRDGLYTKDEQSFINKYSVKKNEYFDSDAYLKSKEYTDKINELNSERDKLFYIKGSDYQTWLLVFGLVELFLLYVLRYSFYGVRSFSNYLKEE